MYNPEVRFNFSNKESKMSKGKALRYLDLLQKEKEKIPSPDKYANLNLHFNDISKKSLIYTSERKFYLNDLMKNAKVTPGIGKYDPYTYDERKLKPPKGCTTLKEEKISHTECVMYEGKSKPGFKDPIDLVSLAFLILNYCIAKNKTKDSFVYFKTRIRNGEIKNQIIWKERQLSWSSFI